MRLSLIALFLFSITALAYVPPSQYIVNQLAEKRKGKKLVWISSKLVLPQTTAADGSSELNEILVVDYFNRRIHSRLFNSKNELLYAMSKKLFEGRAAGSATLNILTHYLLFSAKPEELTQELKIFGIPVVSEAALARLNDETARRQAEKTALRRWNQGLTWVLGREMTGDTRAQLWIEKDSFLPLRLVNRLSDEGDSQLKVEELRLADHRFSQSYNYPGLIQFYREDVLVFESKMDKIAVDPKKQYPPPTASGFTELGRNESSDVRGIIEKYYQYVR